MIYYVETGVIIIVLALLLVTWTYAQGIVWHLSSFSAFRDAVSAVEKKPIAAVKEAHFEAPISVRSLGERRLSEVLQGSFDPNFNLRLGRCYGAIFLKDETIEETIGRVRKSCLFVLLGLAAGCAAAALDDSFMKEVARSGAIQRLPLLFHRLHSYDFVMVTELASIVFFAVSLADAGGTLKRLRSEFSNG